MPPGAAYLFLLGAAAGVALLTTTSYRWVSPRWLRGLLMAVGLFVMSRYVAMALFTTADAPSRFWAWRYSWFATSLGLPLSSVFAIDQLLRHPAMTPKRLLGWFSPFLVVYGLVILFGPLTPVPDRVIGWTVRLSPGWRMLLMGAHTIFVIGFVGLGLGLMRKVPASPIRVALLGLIASQLYLAFDGIWLALGHWYFRPYLYSELAALLALWHAYETSARLHHNA